MATTSPRTSGRRVVKKEKEKAVVFKPVDEELLAKVAAGFRSQTKEFEFWLDPSMVEGTVPKELFGTFLRNGPGLSDVYGTKLKHPIDGDGMVCAVSFVDGQVHFRSRYVQTWSHAAEAKAGKMLFRGQMGSMPPTEDGKEEEAPKFKFRHPANTNVFFWGGKILTCYETGLPYTLDPVTLETVCKDTLGGALDLRAFAAHFRYDATQDVLATLSLRPGVDGVGTVAFYEFDSEWNLKNKVKHKIPFMNYAHDFLLTPDWYIVHMSPFVSMDAEVTMSILRGEASPGETMKYHPDHPCRIVFIPRHGRTSCDGEDDPALHGIVQLDVPPCHIYHFGSCVQREGSKIEFNACCLGPEFNMTFSHGSWLSNADVEPGLMYEFKADLPALRITRTLQDTSSCEFPAVHPYRHVIPPHQTHLVPRFSYLMAADRGAPLPYQDIVKCDAKGTRRQVWNAEGVIGEPVFVPRHGRSVTAKEDDGWVLAQMYDLDTKTTQFVVLDAAHLDAGPVCRLRIGQHIPYGFHGTFTPEVFVPPRTRSSL